MSEFDAATFAHLRVHSHYSLLEATAAVPALVARAAAAGCRALALTDSNALYGAVAFSRACRAAGIRPIIGMTLAVAAPPDALPDDRPAPGQLVLLAANSGGYRNLCRLSACLQAHPDREARLRQGVSWEALRDAADGLICIEAGAEGWLARALRAGQRQAAARYASRLGAIFAERCYLGLTLAQLDDPAALRALVQLGGRFGIRPVAAQPITCLTPEEDALRPLLAAMAQNGRVADVPPFPYPTHWIEPEEITARFADLPEALTAVRDIAQACGDCLPDGAPIWPAL
ncbi:MAG: PHP domain-containing protein, partial [Anaerolineales bacterium]|nr:PHP domain-containing protein [Anaerolineales bacterium]